MKKLSAPQLSMLNRIPAAVILTETYVCDCPPTLVCDENGNRLFQFGAGNSSSFQALVRAGHLEFVGGETVSGIAHRGARIVRRYYVKVAR